MITDAQRRARDEFVNFDKPRISEPSPDHPVLGWNGKEWAYATVQRWHHDDGSRIVPAREIFGNLDGLDDIMRPPRCDHTFGE